MPSLPLPKLNAIQGLLALFPLFERLLLLPLEDRRAPRRGRRFDPDSSGTTLRSRRQRRWRGCFQLQTRRPTAASAAAAAAAARAFLSGFARHSTAAVAVIVIPAVYRSRRGSLPLLGSRRFGARHGRNCVVSVAVVSAPTRRRATPRTHRGRKQFEATPRTAPPVCPRPPLMVGNYVPVPVGHERIESFACLTFNRRSRE